MQLGLHLSDAIRSMAKELIAAEKMYLIPFLEHNKSVKQIRHL